MPDLVEIFEETTLNDDVCAMYLHELVGDEPPDYITNFRDFDFL